MQSRMQNVVLIFALVECRKCLRTGYTRVSNSESVFSAKTEYCQEFITKGQSNQQANYKIRSVLSMCLKYKGFGCTKTCANVSSHTKKLQGSLLMACTEDGVFEESKLVHLVH